MQKRLCFVIGAIALISIGCTKKQEGVISESSPSIAPDNGASKPLDNLIPSNPSNLGGMMPAPRQETVQAVQSGSASSKAISKASKKHGKRHKHGKRRHGKKRRH